MSVEPEQQKEEVCNISKQKSEQLISLVYDDLRRIADEKLRHETGSQTLSATALVHEAYLKISKDETSPRWNDQRHFFNAAANAMRRILIDKARAKMRIKRGGELRREEISISKITIPDEDDDIIAINDALNELENTDPEAAEIVRLRYFAGLSWKEVVEMTGLGDRAARRKWTYAKAWLKTWILENG